MKILIIVQIFFDILFLAGLIYLIFRTNSIGKLRNVLKESKEQFEKLIAEAKNWSDKLIANLSLNEKKSEDLIKKMENSYKKLLEEEKKLIIEKPNYDKTKKVLLLYNQGLSLKEISEGLEIPEGEVKLIIDLINFSKKENKIK